MTDTAAEQAGRLAAGNVSARDPAMAKHTAGQVGTHFAGWFSFQPLFARITREQPDLFD
jgi:hypothetical protein